MAKLTRLCRFGLAYSTKNTHRYTEVDENGEELKQGFAIGSLYVRQAVLGEKAPPVILVTIEYEAQA